VTELETSRLLLRSWREEDLDAYARICADPEVMRYLSGTMTRDQAAKQMERWMRHWEERGFGVWAAQEKVKRCLYRLHRTALPRRVARRGAQDRGRLAARSLLLG
jgi:RimJ/RimL family protein N-acetyltransferase